MIIDSPDFTHRVARRVRRARPDLPIVDYVSPSVWAWRPARARQMRGYVDHVLALLPFEPAAHARLGGPDCTYVGHPLVDDIAVLQPNAEEQRIRDVSPATLIVMPGSREAEIRRLMPVFGAGIARLREPIEIVLPTLPALESLMRAEAGKWRLQPRIVPTRDEKYAAMRSGPRRAGRLRHRDIGAGACRRAHGRRLSCVADRGSHRAIDAQHRQDRAAQSDPRSSCRAGIRAGRLLAGKSR